MGSVYQRHRHHLAGTIELLTISCLDKGIPTVVSNYLTLAGVNVTIGFEDVSIIINEPDGVATLTVVVLDGLLQRPVEVFLSSADDTATSSGVLDFLNLTDLVLEFDEDTLALEINVTIIDDDILENFETFFASLKLDTDNPQVVLAPDSAKVEIRDVDDGKTCGTYFQNLKDRAAKSLT